MNYETIAPEEQINKTIAALAERNVQAELVANGEEALEKIKTLIPQGASVMNGASVTLETIGFVDYLQSGQHGWNNLHEGIIKEQDKAKQSQLRKQAVLSDYYLGSVHALSQNGQFLIASNTGSQLPHIVFTSQNLIFVVGAQKIVASLDEAFKRLEDYVVPKEEVHMQEKYGAHTYPSKVVLFNREKPESGRTVKMLIVNEQLGF